MDVIYYLFFFNLVNNLISFPVIIFPRMFMEQFLGIGAYHTKDWKE